MTTVIHLPRNAGKAKKQGKMTPESKALLEVWQVKARAKARAIEAKKLANSLQAKPVPAQTRLIRQTRENIEREKDDLEVNMLSSKSRPYESKYEPKQTWGNLWLTDFWIKVLNSLYEQYLTIRLKLYQENLDMLLQGNLNILSEYKIDCLWEQALETYKETYKLAVKECKG